MAMPLDAPDPESFFLSPNAPQPREYQKAIIKSALAKGSTLVVLPTGLGKTLIAAAVAAAKLKDGKVLFLAPTRPLVAQHEKTMRELLTLAPEELVMVSGLIAARKRAEMYKPPARLVLSTPQTIANDLAHERLVWDFSLVVFDEVHRTVGKYAYTKVAEAAREHKTMALGLTASPGGQNKRIQEIIDSLAITNVEIRSSNDPDVAPYVKQLDVEWIEVELPQESRELKKLLDDIINDRAATLQKMGFVGGYKSKKGLSELRARILQSSSPLRFSALSHHATLFSMVHILELFETQGVEAVSRFIGRVKEREPSKAQLRLLSDKRFVLFMERLKGCAEHPKLAKLLEVLGRRQEGEKSIVFCQYRDQVEVLVRAIEAGGKPARSFMGKKDGVTAKGQAQTILDFREGRFNILVATSIGEEGLDIPSVDNVIFYEPVPSEIRTIQRRGRAGRAKVGRMIGFITKGTRDQASFWSAKRKEEKMTRVVGRMAGRTPQEWKNAGEERKGASGGWKCAGGEQGDASERWKSAGADWKNKTAYRYRKAEGAGEKPAQKEEKKNSPSPEENAPVAQEKKEASPAPAQEKREMEKLPDTSPTQEEKTKKKGQTKIGDY